MKVITFTRADGGVSVIIPAVESRLEDEPEDAWLARVLARNHEAGSIPEGATDFKVVEQDVLPTDRTFRNAWRQNGKGVDVDLTAARDIARDKIRSHRSTAFPALDGESLRAMEKGDQAAIAAVAARKTKLRDAPADARLDAAKTPDELKASMEAIIGEIAAA